MSETAGGDLPGGEGPARDPWPRGVPDSMLDDLDAVLDAALDAAEPGALVRRGLDGEFDGSTDGGPPELPGAPVVLAVGKAAPAMARAAAESLEGRHRGGVVLAPRSDGPRRATAGASSSELGAPGLTLLRGGHPLPDADGRAAVGRIRERAREAGRSGWPVLLLLSGGGSALLTAPRDGLSLDDLRATTRILMEAGADIRALNTVRKHLETLKGGGLARLVAPAPVRALVLSDVVGDPLDVIASGPVSPDPTTFGDALAVLDELGVRGTLPAAVTDHLEAGSVGDRRETPGTEDPCFRGVGARIVGNVETAARGAMAAAGARGYLPHLLTTEVSGEAREVGRRLGRLARRTRKGAGPVPPPACIVAGGETTVTVTGGGTGGRNQEVALAAAPEIAGLDGVLVASLGTDGVDGPTDAAGGRVTGATLERARSRGVALDEALGHNDAYPFLEALDDLLITGPTGTNVMDVQVILVR